MTNTKTKERPDADAEEKRGLIDLSELDTGKSPGRVYLRHPVSGEFIKAGAKGTPDEHLWIEVWSRDSEIFRKAQSKQIREMAEQKARETRRNRNKQIAIPDTDENEASFRRVLAAATASWHPEMGLEGKALLCTPGNAEILYERIRWIYEQVEQAVNDRGNFIQAS